MRSFVLAAILFPALFSPLAARAEEKQWTDAPVPNVQSGATVMPAARAGQAGEATHDAPFSGIPTGSVAAGGATSTNERNDVGTPSVSR